MSMTPSRRTIKNITLGDLAADDRLMVVRCNLCRRTSYFLASDLMRVYGAKAKMHGVFEQCSKCGRFHYLHVGTRLPNADDIGKLKVRRPKLVHVQWSWREVPYEDPKRRPQTSREFIARSRGDWP